MNSHHLTNLSITLKFSVAKKILETIFSSFPFHSSIVGLQCCVSFWSIASDSVLYRDIDMYIDIIDMYIDIIYMYIHIYSIYSFLDSFPFFVITRY